FTIHWLGLRGIPHLPFSTEPLSDEPLVSVIIAAKNEEKEIKQTIQTIAKQNYTQLELIVVNDRSTDRTGELAEQAAASAHIPIYVVHIDELPNGWLGKNHALQIGFERAKGSYILFTDADVQFNPNAIRSASHYMYIHRLDHLTLAPYMKAPSFWLRGF